MAKSIREQIAALEAKLAALKVQAENEIDPSSIVAGATVSFEYGKGDTKRTLSGVITGIKPADPAVPKSATLIRVAVGEGFDAQIVTIYPTAVRSVAKVEAAVEAA